MSVVVTGIGATTPFGDAAATWRALCDGRTAVRDWPDLARDGFRVRRAARVADRPPGVAGALGLGVGAALAAWADAGRPAGERAVVVGSTMGLSAWYESDPDDRDDAGGGPQRYADAVAAAIGGATLIRTCSTACAAGNHAIAAAARLVADRRVAVAVAGGVDGFSRLALTGFSRSRAMDPDQCRPFDAERGGMQLGEAAAFLVLERAEAARARGAPAYARVRALGMSGDAYHPVAPRPDGDGMMRAMADALRRAGVDAAEVGHVSAHGTGTRASDAAEARAVAALFGGGVVVAGIKGALGHSMGAAAALEALVAALSLRHGLIPPTAGTRALDPAMSIDLALEPRPAPGLRYALSNAFGFGGINSALLLEAA